MKQLKSSEVPAAVLEPDIERELLRAYIDSANDAIFVVCDEMKFLVANDLLADWFAIPEAELVSHGRRLPILHYLGVDTSVQSFEQYFRKVLDGEPARFEMQIAPARGSTRWVEVSLNRVAIEELMVIGIMRDITERRELMKTISEHASTDDLTGLGNRREFQRRLEDLFDGTRTTDSTHVLIYIDLDQFKVVNDTCGHPAGDELMRQIATHIQAAVPPHNTLARLGGDEFGVLISDCDVEQAMAIAEAIRDGVAAFEFFWDTRSFRVSASIGLCAIDRRSVSPQAVLSAADAACYVAKDKGRNRVQLYFGGKDCSRKRSEMEWVPRIEQALREDRLQMHYQTILPLKGLADASTYMETLLRLIDESGAIVPPGLFFPAAERYNLMPAIDRWVVEQLLIRHPEKWVDRGADGGHPAFSHCGINLSGASLNDDAFIAFLEDTLARTPVAHASICFEITETVAISNLSRATEVMQALKALGCRFALDDFGKGMSSFGYLRSLPVDYLKIDGALVRGVTEDDVACTMVEAINRIAYSMDIQTIAEFVENEQVLKRLRAIGVDFAQGFGIHRPEPL